MSLKDDIHWDEYCLLLSKRKKVNTEELVAMKPVGFPLEKQVDVYNKIKQYIPSAYHETLCSKPTDSEILEIRKLKSSRANKYKKKNVR